MFRTFLLILGLTLAGCTHSLHIAHVSDFSPTYKAYTGGELVKATAEQFSFLGFTDNTDFVDVAYKKLQNSCEGGSIQGITTQYATAHGFFSWTHSIQMQGLCVR